MGRQRTIDREKLLEAIFDIVMEPRGCRSDYRYGGQKNGDF